MKRKFRTKRNKQLTENEKRLNYFSNSIFFLNCILFLVIGWVNYATPYETAAARDIAGLMVIFAFMVTIGFALTLQLSVEMRCIFSILFFAVTIFSQHQFFLAYTFKIGVFLTVISIGFLGFTFSKSILSLIFSKKKRPSNIHVKGLKLQ